MPVAGCGQASWYNDDQQFGAAIREVEEAKRLVLHWPAGLASLLGKSGLADVASLLRESELSLCGEQVLSPDLALPRLASPLDLA